MPSKFEETLNHPLDYRSTQDQFRGWNGELKGKISDNGSFIWICKYQFDGQEIKVKKGSVMLIR